MPNILQRPSENLYGPPHWVDNVVFFVALGVLVVVFVASLLWSH